MWQYGACALHAGYLRQQTHLEYVTHFAFPLQRWLHECSVICYKPIDSLVLFPRWRSVSLKPNTLFLNICTCTLSSDSDLTWPAESNNHCACDPVPMSQSCCLIMVCTRGERSEVDGGIWRKAAAGERDKDGTPWVFECHAGPARSLLWPACQVSDRAFQWYGQLKLFATLLAMCGP